MTAPLRNLHWAPPAELPDEICDACYREVGNDWAIHFRGMILCESCAVHKDRCDGCGFLRCMCDES